MQKSRSRIGEQTRHRSRPAAKLGLKFETTPGEPQSLSAQNPSNFTAQAKRSKGRRVREGGARQMPHRGAPAPSRLLGAAGIASPPPIPLLRRSARRRPHIEGAILGPDWGCLVGLRWFMGWMGCRLVTLFIVGLRFNARGRPIGQASSNIG